jgi:hypothetical protein
MYTGYFISPAFLLCSANTGVCGMILAPRGRRSTRLASAEAAAQAAGLDVCRYRLRRLSCVRTSRA